MNTDPTSSSQVKQFNRLLKRLSTGELTDAERRELDELCAGSEAWRAEVRQIEAMLAAARRRPVDRPSEFERAAFTTRLKASVEVKRPKPYGALRTWLSALRLSPAFATRRLAVAASVTVAVAMVIALIALRPGSQQPEPFVPPLVLLTPEQIEEAYPVAEDADMLPGEHLLTLERELQDELDAVRQLIEQAPPPYGEEMTDEEIVFG